MLIPNEIASIFVVKLYAYYFFLLKGIISCCKRISYLQAIIYGQKWKNRRLNPYQIR